LSNKAPFSSTAAPIEARHAAGESRKEAAEFADALAQAETADEQQELFLAALGQRAKAQRVRRGLTRKALARLAGVSERHLANLEYGVGNASILVLLQVAQALQCSLAQLVGDVTTQSPEWLMLREALGACDEATLRRVRLAAIDLVGGGSPPSDEAPAHSSRIALIGLRGAGKSTLGRMLAEDLDFPFVELSREIEKLAGCSVSEVLGLYGQNAYRRYERRALERIVHMPPKIVLATGGGLVSEPATFGRLLDSFFAIWIEASPEEHWDRVIRQGDQRVAVSGDTEALADMRRILAQRHPLYGRADARLQTRGKTARQSLTELINLTRAHVGQALPTQRVP
jgi:XRE family transcriptional regulator, aerobic/anaerobic benzoate catabolism transcriptional regulator